MRKYSLGHRHGALTVEAAFVFPLMMFLLLGMVIGGMGVLRFQQVACQARETARFAAVHGGDYQLFPNAGLTHGTSDEGSSKAVEPMAAGMAVESLALQVQWIDQVHREGFDFAA